MTAIEYFNGKQWVINVGANNEVAGRSLEQAKYTADLIEHGKVWFDGDGIGFRINATPESDGSVTLAAA